MFVHEVPPYALQMHFVEAVWKENVSRFLKFDFSRDWVVVIVSIVSGSAPLFLQDVRR
jgi:hypothetical protein